MSQFGAPRDSDSIDLGRGLGIKTVKISWCESHIQQSLRTTQVCFVYFKDTLFLRLAKEECACAYITEVKGVKCIFSQASMCLWSR